MVAHPTVMGPTQGGPYAGVKRGGRPPPETGLRAPVNICVGANGYLRSTSCISKVSMMSPISMSLKEPRLIPAS